MAAVAALPPRTRRANAFAALEDADSAAEAFHASIDAVCLPVVVQQHLPFPICNKVSQRQPDDSIQGPQVVDPLVGFARQCPDGSARALLSSSAATVGRGCEVATFDGSTACDFSHTNSVPPTSPAQIHGVYMQIRPERHA